MYIYAYSTRVRIASPNIMLHSKENGHKNQLSAKYLQLIQTHYYNDYGTKNMSYKRRSKHTMPSRAMCRARPKSYAFSTGLSAEHIKYRGVLGLLFVTRDI